jgi:hypothetical protein
LLKDYQVKGTAATLATNKLFQVKENAKSLTIKKAILFHSAVAKLLYLAKRSRPDLLATVAFLSTRVSKSTEEDMSKLNRLLRYLKRTKGLRIIIETDDEFHLLAFIDASFGIHTGSFIHTGTYIYTFRWKESYRFNYYLWERSIVLRLMKAKVSHEVFDRSRASWYVN